MDKKDFNTWLSQIAEWKQIRIEPEGKTGKRGRRTLEEMYQDSSEEDFLEQHPDGINPSIPPVLVKLKTTPCVCDDCGCVKQGRLVEYKKYTYPEQHWRAFCTACQKWQDPETKEFSVTKTGVTFAFRKWFAKKL